MKKKQLQDSKFKIKVWEVKQWIDHHILYKKSIAVSLKKNIGINCNSATSDLFTHKKKIRFILLYALIATSFVGKIWDLFCLHMWVKRTKNLRCE